MDIKEMDDGDRAAWDAFVRSSVHGMHYHLSGWKNVFEDTYGYRTHYLMATESERIVGIFPLLIIRSFLVGSRVSSVQGGLCAENEEVAAALIEQGKEVAARARLKQLVIQDGHKAWPGNLATTNQHIHWMINIQSNTDIHWRSLSSKVRQEVRKALNNGLESWVDYTGEYLDDLYQILSHFAHQAGTPFFRRTLLERITRSFPGGYHSVLVYRKNEPLAGYFLLDMGEASFGAWGSTLPQYHSLETTYLAYWTIVRDASERGFTRLDLGRSPAQSSSSAFKGKWGGVSQPVFQQVMSLSENHIESSLTNQIRTSDKFQFFMKIWPRLPFPVVQYIGPKLRRHVPFA